MTAGSDSNTPLRRMQALHGLLLVILLAIAMVVPGLQAWPLFFLLPIVAYGIIVLLIPSFRRTATWVRLGRFDGMVALATICVIAVTSLALVFWYWLMEPDLSPLRAKAPPWVFQAEHALLAGVVFSLLNALLEEIIFRGVLLDGLEAELGARGAMVLQAVLFGIAHRGGFPSGWIGVAMAAIFGLMLGLLRTRSGGLAAPYACHVCADATIYLIMFADAKR